MLLLDDVAAFVETDDEVFFAEATELVVLVALLDEFFVVSELVVAVAFLLDATDELFALLELFLLLDTTDELFALLELFLLLAIDELFALLELFLLLATDELFALLELFLLLATDELFALLELFLLLGHHHRFRAEEQHAERVRALIQRQALDVQPHAFCEYKGVMLAPVCRGVRAEGAQKLLRALFDLVLAEDGDHVVAQPPVPPFRHVPQVPARAGPEFHP